MRTREELISVIDGALASSAQVHAGPLRELLAEAVEQIRLDTTAPSRAPDGGVTRESALELIHKHLYGEPEDEVLFERLADDLARLAASHAGDRERLDLFAAARALYVWDHSESAAQREWDQERVDVAPYLSKARAVIRALAPAAGQDDARECG